MCDVWYGPAVLADKPAVRFGSTETTSGTLLRSVSPTLDVRAQTCRVTYDLWRLEHGRVAEMASEDHLMRFFFPRELQLFLEVSGFSLQRLSGFPNLDVDASESTWNVTVVARAETAPGGAR